jgi:hypothetical protein
MSMCEIRRFHGTDCEEYYYLLFGTSLPTFRRKLLPQSSRLSSKPKQKKEAALRRRWSALNNPFTKILMGDFLASPYT